MHTRFVVLLAIVLSASAYPSSNTSDEAAAPKEDESTWSGVYRMIEDCGDADISICLKMRALTYVDKALRKPEDIKIVDGITLVKSETNSEAYRGLNGRALSQDELDASLPKNEDDRNTQVDNMLFDRVSRFLESHTLQLRVPQSSIVEMKRSLEEARDKKKKAAKKILPALALMFIFKTIAAIPFILGTLALIAFKALLIGKIALVLSAIIGLHKLLSQKHHSQTVEVVAHPHHTEEHAGHHYAAAARSLKDAHELAYNAYLPHNKVN